MDPVSRRDLFRMFRPKTGPGSPGGLSGSSGRGQPDPTRVAVILGGQCLALTTYCSACSEQCPAPGAIQHSQGLPLVVPFQCTGCGICHDVCPVPGKAIRLLPRASLGTRAETETD